MINLTIDTSDFLRVAEKFASVKKNINKWAAESINKGLDVGKPMAQTSISARYNVGTPALEVKKANSGNMQGSLKASGGMLPVSQFNPATTGKAVSVSIIRGSRKVVGPMSRGPGVSGAFMVGGRVMERRTSGRYPIAPVSTIGIPGMLASKAVGEPVQEKIAELTFDELKRLMA